MRLRDPSTAHDFVQETFLAALKGVTLARAADDFNSKLLELRLEETIPDISQPVPYKSFELKIQRSFGSDFDDL